MVWYLVSLADKACFYYFHSLQVRGFFLIVHISGLTNLVPVCICNMPVRCCACVIDCNSKMKSHRKSNLIFLEGCYNKVLVKFGLPKSSAFPIHFFNFLNFLKTKKYYDLCNCTSVNFTQRFSS